MATKSKPQKLAITNVRVFDGQRVTEPTTVVVDGDVIGNDADGAVQYDGEGGVLMPGLIDAHIHLDTERELILMAQSGITTALDMATWPPSKIEALRGRDGLTDFRTPGVPAITSASMHRVLFPTIRDEDLVESPDDAVRFVKDRIAEKTDYVKVVCDDPGPSQESINALVAEAHKHDKLVIAHATTRATYEMAQDAKADVLTHAPVDQTLDEAAVTRMKQDGRICVPTLTMMEAVTGPLSWTAILKMLMQPTLLWAIIKVKRKSGSGGGKPAYGNARDSVTALHRAGVPILAGTDAHYEPQSPFDVRHGESLHHELELLVEAGLSTVEALQAATSLPAKHFGLADRGKIEAGMRADLVLLAEDPIEDIKATRSIRKVWCAGMEVDVS